MGSTLTQPTAASAAKSAPSKNIKSAPRNPPTKPANNNKTTPQPTSAKQTPSRKPVTVSRNSSTSKKESPLLNARRPDSRCSSPLKSDSRTSSPRKLDSRVTSPVISNVRSPSPMKRSDAVSPRKTARRVEVQQKPAPVPAAPTMQRSGTFLKEEPTVLGKVM